MEPILLPQPAVRRSIVIRSVLRLSLYASVGLALTVGDACDTFVFGDGFEWGSDAAWSGVAP